MKVRQKTDAIGFVLREIRNEKGLSQEEVGERIQADRAYIAYLETGRRYPSVDMLIALAKALEVTPGSLLDRVSAHIDSGKARPIPHKQAGPKKV
jgi:Predicted transcriptional regulators